MTLTKNEIIERVEKSNPKFTLKKSANIVEKLLEAIKKSLESGQDVMISNFGKFTVAEKKERKGRNPSTNTELMLPARRVVTFKTAATLREKMQGNKKR